MRAKVLPPVSRVLSLLAGAGMMMTAGVHAAAQEFINLDFEQTTNYIPFFRCTHHLLPWNVAAPGWSHSDGPDTGIVYYGEPHIGGTPYFLLMDELSPCFATNTHLAGRHSLLFRGGSGDGRLWINAHIAQTGLIPAGARYLHLLAAGNPFKVSVGGVDIPMHSLGDNAFYGDIAPFADTSAELKIQNLPTKDQSTRQHTTIDNIQFLSELPTVNAVAYTGGVYRQDFDTLESGLTNTAYHRLPLGWFTGSFSRSTNYYDWIPLTGALQLALGVHCFSATAEDPDKSIGLRTGDSAHFGVRLRNESGTTWRSLTISFDVEQWATWYESQDIMAFTIGTSNSAATLGNFTEIPALKVTSVRWYSLEPEPENLLDPYVRLDGNAPENRRRIAATISGIAWEPGWSVWLRWTGSSSYGQAVAIDNFALQTQPLLQISPARPGLLRLTWPKDESGFSLEASAHLGTLAVWTRVPDAPVSVDGAWTVEVDAGAAPQFFRLTKP